MTDDSLKIGENKQDQELVDKIKQNLRSVASSIDDNLTWCEDGSAWMRVSEKCREVYGEVTDKKDVFVVNKIMFSYMVGRELPDEDEGRKMVSDARRILNIRTPDLNIRMPWYDVMFGIMDKGHFCSGTDGEGASPWWFELRPAVHQELVDSLAKRTCFEKDAINRVVGYLASAMGPFPGAQYNAHKSVRCMHQRRYPTSRLQEIDLICTYLHAPVAVAFQKGIASDYFMGEINYRRL